MKTSILTITLNPAIDKTLIVPHFKIGNESREQGLTLSAGGKGLNVSRVLKHLGLANTAAGFAGGSHATFLKRQLTEEKIHYYFCPIENNSRTSVTIIDPLGNTITRIMENGPVISAKEAAAFMQRIREIIPNYHYIVISGKNAPGLPDTMYADLLGVAKKHNLFTVLDTSGKPYACGLKKKPFMIAPNLKEAEEATGNTSLTLKKIKQTLVGFHRAGIKIATVTMGPRGAMAYNGKEMLHAIPPRVDRKNPVGCGDAFIAGFIASHAEGNDFAKNVRMATACGTANVLSIKPGLVTPRVVKQIFKDLQVKAVTL